jgi:uncharacterized protein (DUF362 family)
LEKILFVEPCNGYDTVAIDRCLALWDDLFDRTLRSGQSVVLKPNWIASSHKYRETEWESVVTHPAVITSVLAAVLKRLQGAGRVVITDAPLTSCSWSLLMERMKPNLWVQMGKQAGVPVSIMDLRDDEWIVQNDVTVQRKKL